MNLFAYHLFSGISRSINCRNPFVAFRGVAYFLGHLQSDWGLAIIQSADLLQRVQRMQSTVMARNGAPPPTYRLHHPLQVTPTAPRIWSHSLAALLCLRSFFRIVREMMSTSTSSSTECQPYFRFRSRPRPCLHLLLLLFVFALTSAPLFLLHVCLFAMSFA